MRLVDKFKEEKGLASLAKIGTGLLAVGLGFSSYAMANNVEKNIEKNKADNSKNVPQVSQAQTRIEDRRVEARDEIFYGRLDAYLVKIYQERAGREGEKKLQKKGQIKISVPSVQFEETPLEEVVDWFNDITELNFHVNWSSLEIQGVSHNTPVSLKLKNVSPERVLDLVLANAASASGYAGYGGIKLDYMIEGGVVEISTREQLSERMITRVYDVTDLLMTIQDKRGGLSFGLGSGRTGLGSSGGDRGYGGGTSGSRGAGTRGGTGARSTGYGGGGSGRNGGYGGRGIEVGRTGTYTGTGTAGTGDTATSFRTQEGRANNLIELIINTTEPDSWQENGGKGTISIFNGKLVVSNNYFVHEKLGSSSRIR